MKTRTVSLIRFLVIAGVIHLACACLSFAQYQQPDNTNTLSTSQQGSSLKNFSMQWRAGLLGESADSQQSSSKFVGFGFDSKLNYWLAPELFMNVNSIIMMSSGSFQTIDDQNNYQNGIHFMEAGVHWLFLPDSVLSAGALDQSKLHNALLVGPQAFPAVDGSLHLFRIGDFKTAWEAEQAIPTSSTLGTNTSGVESTPRFLSTALNFTYEPTSRYSWKTRVGYFQYDNLPSEVGYQSGLLGNDVLTLSETESNFTYQFHGMEAQTHVVFPMMTGWDAYGDISFLQNSAAPGGYNTAYSATAGSEFFFVGRKSLQLESTGFHIEPDSTVAYFANPLYGNTNRNGYSTSAFLKMSKYNFRIGITYTDAQIMYTNINTTQSHQTSVYLTLETLYANL